MRLPMNGKDVDLVEFEKMVDYFMENGFNYFDTAQVYIDGKSEQALKTCLTSRYPRESYILTDKLSPNRFKTNEEIRPFFFKQLETLGVEYLDYYLIHSVITSNYVQYQETKAFEEVFKLKEEGYIKHVGFSFHDTPETLERILNDHPEVEVVQIQLNYLDYEQAHIKSKENYDVCVKHGKKVLIMEPVKGGTLVNIPDEAKKVFDDLNNGSYASYAIRFAASHNEVITVLSGMSNMEQMKDNVSYMKDFKPLNEEEIEAIKKVTEIIKSNKNSIGCTGCRYCVEGCPQNIAIPEAFASYNEHSSFYYSVSTKDKGKPSDCIKCGRCEQACPQHLSIRDYLVQVDEYFKRKSEEE